ncbi:MAG: alpha,2-mannosyltransferase [Methylobacteriaceae bacterium]|nr:alpha,2-mannosyltransferase [Methylobacteriaceae bacterium]
MWANLKSGSWLTPERLRVYPALLLAFQAIAIVALVATSDGLHDFWGRPLGTDFAQVWVAGREVLGGHPEHPFDVGAHLTAQQAFFGPSSDVYGWHYPPYFLALAALLALLPYAAALAVWQLSTLPIYVGGVYRTLRGSGISRRDVLVGALAFPALFVNLTHGQNGFLTAGLFAGALLCLEARPWLAGLLFALLAYKPQFALVIPLALVAGRHWRALFAGGAGLAGFTALTLASFGVQPWIAFQQSLGFTRSVVLEEGNTGWEKIQSVFSAVRMLGGSVPEAYALQAIVGALVLGAIAWLWHSRADTRLKYAALCVAALLTTPYCLDYDMVLLGPAVAFMVAHGLKRGFAPFEKTLLATAWLVPLLARIVTKLSYMPIGPMIMLLLFGAILIRALNETWASRTLSAPLAVRP